MVLHKSSSLSKLFSDLLKAKKCKRGVTVSCRKAPGVKKSSHKTSSHKGMKKHSKKSSHKGMKKSSKKSSKKKSSKKSSRKGMI
jgi:hypothetical protein